MRVHDQAMFEIGHQSVHARDRPMVGDRSVFRREGLPVVLGNTFLEIENKKAKKYLSFSERGVRGTVVTVNRLKHFAFIKR